MIESYLMSQSDLSHLGESATFEVNLAKLPWSCDYSLGMKYPTGVNAHINRETIIERETLRGLAVPTMTYLQMQYIIHSPALRFATCVNVRCEIHSLPIDMYIPIDGNPLALRVIIRLEEDAPAAAALVHQPRRDIEEAKVQRGSPPRVVRPSREAQEEEAVRKREIDEECIRRAIAAEEVASGIQPCTCVSHLRDEPRPDL